MKKQTFIISTIIALGAGLFANGAYADSASTEFSVTVRPSVSLSIDDPVNLEITPNKDGVYRSTTLGITASTNSTAGYTLVMTTDKTYLESSTVNPNTGTKPTIPSISQAISAQDFEDATSSDVINHWGLAVFDEHGNGDYGAIQTSQIIKTTSTNVTDDTTTLGMASNLDLLTVPGVYSTTLNFQLTANPMPDTLASAYEKANKQKTIINGKSYYAIQDMNSAICADVDIINDQLQVYDRRDNRVYWIAKLADDNCWMTQNLDLDLETNPTNVLALNHDNTDLGWTNTDTTATWTPANNTIIMANGQASGWTSTTGAVLSGDAGDLYIYPSGNTSTNGTVYTSTAACAQAENTTEAECSHYHVGNHYSFKAATAGSTPSSAGLSPDSICPAGWKIPVGAVDEKVKDYPALLDIYDVVALDSSEERASFETGGAIASRKAPFYFTDAGSVSGGNYTLGDRYYYHTNSSRSGNGIPVISVLSQGDSGQFASALNSFADYLGFSVRCVAR